MKFLSPEQVIARLQFRASLTLGRQRHIDKQMIDAIKKGYVREFEQALHQGADQNAKDDNGYRALSLGTRHAFILTLIEHYADPRLINLNGTTPAQHYRAIGRDDLAGILDRHIRILERADQNGKKVVYEVNGKVTIQPASFDGLRHQ